MNVSDIVMIISTCTVWVTAFVAFQVFQMAWYMIILSIVALVAYLFIVYFIPLKKKYDTSISNAKQTYLANKDMIDQVYVSQLKTTWDNDVTGRNMYLILMLSIFCYLPVIYYVFYLWYRPDKMTLIGQFMNWLTLPVSIGLFLLNCILMLLVWLIYTFGFTYLFLYIFIPVIVVGGFLWWSVFYRTWITLYTLLRIGIITGLIAGGYAIGWSNILYSIFAGISVLGVGWGIFIQ